MPERAASIDVGTNTVLLLVAERRGPALAPVLGGLGVMASAERP